MLASIVGPKYNNFSFIPNITTTTDPTRYRSSDNYTFAFKNLRLFSRFISRSVFIHDLITQPPHPSRKPIFSI
jgi:hypothetical protein